MGVEPTRCRHHGILSPARLPVPPQRHLKNTPKKIAFLPERWHNIIVFESFLIIAYLSDKSKKFTADYKKMKKLVLIDGNSVVYRAFYATPYFATSSGLQTNAVYGFVNMLVKIINELKPDHMLVAFDRKEPTYRHIEYPAYKGTRKPMPDELVVQVPVIKKVLTALGIKTCEKAGLEADDIIGCAAKKFPFDTVIITGDRDSFQLVDETTSVYFTKRGITDVDVITLENFKEKTGLNRPSLIVDLKACMGDASDNIPGIPGVGEKTAYSLIDEYGSLEGIYDHVDELKGKLKEKVENGRDSAFMSKRLATIDVTSDLMLSEEDIVFSFPFPYEARKVFAELEFRTFLKKDIFKKENGQNAGADEITAKKSDESSTENDENKDADSGKADSEFYLKSSIKSEILKQITVDIKSFESKSIALVAEKNFNIFDGETEYVFVIKENFFDEGISLEDMLAFLEPLLTGSGINCNLIVYDKKSLKHKLDKLGSRLTAFCDDVMLEKYVVDYTQKELDLTGVIERAGLPVSSPAASLATLHSKYRREMSAQGTLSLYENVELPLSDVLYDMENAGFKIDVDALDEASEIYRSRIAVLADEIIRIAGENFNINSPKQLSDILFVKLGLKHGKKTKTGFSTNADVLEEMADQHPVIPLILKYRQLSKLASTYVDGFRPLIDRSTGLIHTVFNQTVTSTGRLSSKEPNLQNIPVRDEEGKEIRKFFVPRSGNHVLISADYSQIELRLLAHYSGCEPLIAAFNSGEDVHALTASQVFGVAPEDVTPEQRRSAKAVNFGIIYGISEYGLAKNIHVAPKVAAEYINIYFATYTSIKDYMNSNVLFAKEHGYVSTAFGRRRFIPEISSTNYNVRSFGERAAMNMPLQGTAADIIKIAMINVEKRLKKEIPGTLLILQVHDELILDAGIEDLAVAEKILREEMENAVSLSVPLTVNVSYGKNWFDAK